MPAKWMMSPDRHCAVIPVRNRSSYTMFFQGRQLQCQGKGPLDELFDPLQKSGSRRTVNQAVVKR
jgi:hypothetical protein